MGLGLAASDAQRVQMLVFLAVVVLVCADAFSDAQGAPQDVCVLGQVYEESGQTL